MTVGVFISFSPILIIVYSIPMYTPTFSKSNNKSLKMNNLQGKKIRGAIF